MELLIVFAVVALQVRDGFGVALLSQVVNRVLKLVALHVTGVSVLVLCDEFSRLAGRAAAGLMSVCARNPLMVMGVDAAVVGVLHYVADKGFILL